MIKTFNFIALIIINLYFYWMNRAQCKKRTEQKPLVGKKSKTLSPPFFAQGDK